MTPMMGNKLPDDRTWAADTGMFAAPEQFDPIGYLHWLWKRRDHAHRCLFASAPDVVGDAAATLKLARRYLPLIRALGYPVALVAQDGLEDMTPPWDDFDCLFVGGTTDWKLSEAAYHLVAEAKQKGKWCHMGRVNSERRLRAAALSGYDSADGTYIAFGPDINTVRLSGWLQRLDQQSPLALFAGEAMQQERGRDE